MASTGGTASRGGWSWTLQTVNLMEGPREQGSLTEDLRRGVGMAHRQHAWGPQEQRNFRRTEPLKDGDGHSAEGFPAAQSSGGLAKESATGLRAASTSPPQLPADVGVASRPSSDASRSILAAPLRWRTQAGWRPGARR